ncbi:mRNA capping enzyme alpha subunit [Giardia muris]|uniref:mRNA guanylyltransferase n=1 Tax=Giardia muris TaxID=5742 RepID=A0A4Z1TDS8_GIAMU|nr:mRNA capping enzyme alpha subunit [Giardia muris]|eukprot:TNJ30709.1 mRNA capping enzyme alpha subunit [Giardia muris]
MDKLTQSFVKQLELYSQDDASLFQQVITQVLGMDPGVQMFPGAQPVSLEPHKGLSDIVHTDYLACEKTDGTRFLLYLPPCNKNWLYTPESITIERDYFYIDRAYSFRRAKGNLLLKGVCQALGITEAEVEAAITTDRQATLAKRVNSFTLLFDGEVVQDTIAGKDVLAFYVFDSLIFINSTFALDLRKRLEIANRLPELLIHLSPEAIEFKTKVFYEKSQIRELFRLIEAKELPHKSDGVIFTSVDEPYTPGTCHSIQKWKPLEQNTVDLCVKCSQERNTKLLTEAEYACLLKDISRRRAEATDGSLMEAVQSAISPEAEKIVSELVKRPAATKNEAQLFLSQDRLLEPYPVDVMFLDDKKYAGLSKREQDLYSRERALILEVRWDKTKETITYDDVSSLIFQYYPQLQRTCRSINIQRKRQGGWASVKPREDKERPNHRFVFESVCRSYDEHIDEETLCGILLGEIRLPNGGSPSQLSPYLLRPIRTPGYEY